MYVRTFSKALLLVILILLLEFLFLALLEFMKGSIFGVDIIFIVMLFPYFFSEFCSKSCGCCRHSKELFACETYNTSLCFMLLMRLISRISKRVICLRYRERHGSTHYSTSCLNTISFFLCHTYEIYLQK